jgi:heme-degrading monooxygenase HmoA/ketosteroid isomerase-like protein
MTTDSRVIVFRSRLCPGVEQAYDADVTGIAALASTMPGLLLSKDFVAEDGERLALIEFDSAEHLTGWREHGDHQRAQQRGRDQWYSEYRIQICSVLRQSHYDKGAGTLERQDRDPARLRQIAERWLDAFARHHLEDLLALYAEDAVHTSPKIRARHPETGGFLRGKPALREWWREAFERLPELRYEPISITADAERVFMEYLRKVPGEPELPVAEVLDVVGGQIVASRVFHG